MTLPTTSVRASFLAAMAEFRAEGRGGPTDDTWIGLAHRAWAGRWHVDDGFARFVEAVRADADEATPRAADLVASTTYWWVDGHVYLGRLSIRHGLNAWLREVGGHIGYDVRPSARRRGHATAMLRAALPLAHELGIDPALITCDVDNAASRKVIEAGGGLLEDERNGKLRFWVPTSP